LVSLSRSLVGLLALEEWSVSVVEAHYDGTM